MVVVEVEVEEDKKRSDVGAIAGISRERRPDKGTAR